MKTLKKIMAFAVCLVMVLAMTVTAFADDNPTTYKISFPTGNEYQSHSYEIYQIFTATMGKKTEGETTTTVVSDVKWGKNGINNGNAINEGDSVPDSVLTELKGVNSSSDTQKLVVIKKYANLSNPVKTLTSSDKTYNAVPGYYLIKDVLSSASDADKNDTYSLYMVQVVAKDIDIAPKSELPSFEKKVKDINDSSEKDYTGWQDSADYDIGDNVKFKLEGTVANNYDYYNAYYFAFHDKEEQGLTFQPKTVKVYIENGENILELNENDYELKYNNDNNVTKPTDSCTFEVVFKNLKKISSVKAGTKIRVEYESKLNDKANIGKQGNKNEAQLVFSNNPNDEWDGTTGDKPNDTGETPWDNVIVFTYQVIVNKVDENKNALNGATFELQKKKTPSGDYETISTIIGTESSVFEFKGLDDGEYQLVEKKAPDGYNTISPIKFKITANHEVTWEGQDRGEILTSVITDKPDLFTAGTDDNIGKINTEIQDLPGSTLPSTGGIGTRIFYIIGGLLMAAAAVVLITKVRFNKNK